MTSFADVVREKGHVPLSFVTAQGDQSYLNFGDALSAVMVAMVSGLPVRHTGQESSEPRMAAVGTIGHAQAGGEVWFWGTGASRFRNPHAPAAQRVPFTPDPATRRHVCATRGPISWQILTGGRAERTPVYGDPVWLLPRYYRAPAAKTHDLGVIVHLADLDGRALAAAPKADYSRYHVPAGGPSVRMINTLTDLTVSALEEKLVEILSCRRIVSTSLHGMVLAESFGIPCLYFAPRGPAKGVCTVELADNPGLDLRIADLYLGLGRTRQPVYVQPRREETRWDALIAAIDATWEPPAFDADPLIARFPLPYAPVVDRPSADLFAQPAVANAAVLPPSRTAPALGSRLRGVLGRFLPQSG